MKTSNVIRPTTLALALVAWLLLPQAAHCFYNPSTGRWLSRDPVQERGGLNPYCFVGNGPVHSYDVLGKLNVIFTGGGSYVMVTVTPTATVSAACAGGPLHLNVHFEASYDDEGANWMNSVGAWFSYDGNGTAISNFQDSPMRWDVAYLKQLPACPTTRQSGSMDFDAGDSTDGLILTIIFNWHYRCDCRCNEVEPFKASYTYFAFPPLRPPPRPGAGLSTML